MKKNCFFVVWFLVTSFLFAQTENDFQVALTADYTGAIITKYTGQGIATVRIPETLQEFPVKEIANSVFRGNQTITSVALPSTIEKIGVEAFFGCRNLSVITIPNNVIQISFERGKRTENGKSIDSDSFDNCNIYLSSQSILKRKGYPGIFNEKSFTENNLTTIVTLTKDYTGLVITRFRYAKDFQHSKSRATPYPPDLSDFPSILNVSIPAMIEGMPIKEIGPNSFFTREYRYLKVGFQPSEDGHDFRTTNIRITNNLTIPEGVEVINEYAFGTDGDGKSYPGGNTSATWYEGGGQMFKTIVLPRTLKILANGAFYRCSNLTEIIIPDNVTLIGNKVFEGTKLKQINLSSSNVSSIGDRAFANCPLTSVTLPLTLKIIGDEAFANTGLTTITIPESVEVIRGNAFRGTKFPLPIQAELRRRGYTGSF